ncbi:MAG: hypothetical protein LBG44_11645 [Gemmatimonadota bacterium]|nr:hypothetical protein [Gemmatimonadota bacterium]
MDESREERLALDEVLVEAARLVDDGEEEAALRMLLDAERDHPSDATLLCMTGVVADQIGAEGMAADFFRRCLAEEPTDPELLVRAGSALARSGDPSAEPALRLAVLTAPDFAQARLHYGVFLVRGGVLEQGLEELAIARTLDPGDADIRRETAIGMLLAGRETEARVEMEAAIDLDGTDLESRFLFGLLLLLADDMAGAAEVLYPAAAGMEDDGDAQLIFALTFGIEGWMDEAWQAIARAETAAAPADPEAAREVEEALEEGEEEMREMLMTELAPSALRSRIRV